MKKSKSALFLMELIIVIFFFALTSAVCLRVFVKAHDTAVDTKSMNYAVLWAENAAECFYEYGADESRIRNLLDSAFSLQDYKYYISFSEDADYDYMDYSFTDVLRDKEVYSFTFKKHKQEVRK